jgi:drug/metabolite transporter (DMT)-like permease
MYSQIAFRIGARHALDERQRRADRQRLIRGMASSLQRAGILGCLPAIPMRSARVRAVLALVLANAIWGTTFVATKPMLDRVPPLTIASGRFAVALLVLFPLVWRAGGRPTLGREAALLGFTGVFLLYLTQNVGLDYTSATNGALIHGGIPVLTALLAVPLLGERFDRRRFGGIVASMAGVAAVVLLGSGSGVGGSVLGDALLLVSAVALAAYLVLGRRIFPSGGSLELVAGVACYGLLFLLPASAIELTVQGMARPTGGDLLGLLYLGTVASALAFVLWAYGLRHLEAGQAAVFANLTPLVGVAVAALLLGERVTVVQFGGGLLILGGVWLTTRRPAAGRGAGTLMPGRLVLGHGYARSRTLAASPERVCGS